MNLVLGNGTQVRHADAKLLRFMQSEFELYDGIPVLQDSTLSLFDILLSVMMNSRLDTADKVRSIWKNKKPVEEALSRIPTDVSLEDDNVPWDDLKALFDAFCAILWAGPAVSTKILYKKRPNLIPIYDSVISACINDCNDEPSLPQGSSEGAHMIRGIKCFRKLLVGSIGGIQHLRNLPEMRRFPVSPTRILEVLLWIENEDNGYYQICPKCHTGAVMPIRYGQPTQRLQKLAAARKVKLCSDSTLPGRPRWHCGNCLTEWGKVR